MVWFFFVVVVFFFYFGTIRMWLVIFASKLPLVPLETQLKLQPLTQGCFENVIFKKPHKKSDWHFFFFFFFSHLVDQLLP